MKVIKVMKKTVKHAAPVLMLPLLFASCLKDTELIGPDAPGAIANIIEFGNLTEPSSPQTSSIPKYSLSFDMKPSAEMNLKIRCVGAEKAKEDIRVTIALDNSLIGAYNTENDLGPNEVLTVMPAARYDVPVTEAVIKKGEREAIIPIDLKSDQFTFDANYALGFSIASASSGVISGNFGKIVLELGAKNAYDGKYTYAASANTALQPGKKGPATLETVGPNTVRLMPGLLITYPNQVTYTVDPATNKVTVEMTTLKPIETDPSSHYDPATKTFHLKWWSNNKGRLFEETITYTGPRD